MGRGSSSFNLFTRISPPFLAVRWQMGHGTIPFDAKIHNGAQYKHVWWASRLECVNSWTSLHPHTQCLFTHLPFWVPKDVQCQPWEDTDGRHSPHPTMIIFCNRSPGQMSRHLSSGELARAGHQAGRPSASGLHWSKSQSSVMSRGRGPACLWRHKGCPGGWPWCSQLGGWAPWHRLLESALHLSSVVRARFLFLLFLSLLVSSSPLACPAPPPTWASSSNSPFSHTESVNCLLGDLDHSGLV